MRLIKINTSSNGSHVNCTTSLTVVPEGWAVIPDDMETPNFPFGEIEVEEIDGIPTVTKWTPGVVPEPEEISKEPTAQDDIDAMLVDHEYRLTLLELGVNE